MAGNARGALALLLLAALVSSCGAEDRVVIGRVGSESGEVETAPLPCSDPLPGPNANGPMLWCTIQDGAATAEWVAAPSPTEARARVVPRPNAAAGLAFAFDEAGTVVDLSGYDHLTFEGEFPTGVPFDVIVGRSRDRGCSFPRPTGAGRAVYAVDLTNPAWCSPSLCDYDLHASGAYFLMSEPIGTEAELAIQNVGAERLSIAAGSVSAMRAKVGLGGYCWFPFAWYEDTSAELVQATSDVVRARAKGLPNRTAGVAFELPAGFDPGAYRRLEIDATIAPNGPFLVQLVRERRGLTWTLQASGTRTYTVELEATVATPWGSPMTISDANRVEIATVYATGGTLEVTITGVRFVP